MTLHRPLALLMTMIATLPAPAAAQRARQNGIVATEGWSRATAPRAEVGAGFLTLHNRGRQADRLLSATSPRSGRVEIHTMTMEGGVMRMRPLPNGIAVPAGGTIGLAPGGNHLMLIGLKSPLKRGERVPVTLRFARSGTVRMTLAVAAPGATAPANHGEQY